MFDELGLTVELSYKLADIFQFEAGDSLDDKLSLSHPSTLWTRRKSTILDIIPQAESLNAIAPKKNPSPRPVIATKDLASWFLQLQ